MNSFSFLHRFKQLAMAEWRQMKPGLERIYQACEKLGHPERQFRSIHIAGTNGKGSVTAMLHSILNEAGYTTGRFVSPHLVKVNERFVIGKEEISDEELEEILQKIHQTVPIFVEDLNPESPPLTFFEICTLVAFLYFAKQKVDLAIIETGLGGRLDSTNILTPLVSVITEISLDHTEILGPDISSIAQEKAGIIKYKTPIVCGSTDPTVKKIIETIAKEKEADFYEVTPPKILLGGFFDWKKYRKLQTNLLGSHQIRNASIALTTLEVLSEKGYLIRESSIQSGLISVAWPGRLEFLSTNGQRSIPVVLLDGAHNPAGMKTVVDFIKEFKAVKKWKVLFGAVSGKAVEEMLGLLASVTDEIVVCKMENSRSINPEKMINPQLKISSLSAFETYRKILEEIKPEEGLLVTGSLYLIGEIKEKLTQV